MCKNNLTFIYVNANKMLSLSVKIQLRCNQPALLKNSVDALQRGTFLSDQAIQAFPNIDPYKHIPIKGLQNLGIIPLNN